MPIVLPPASVPVSWKDSSANLVGQHALTVCEQVIPDTTGVGEGAVTSTVISTIVTGGSTITTSYITTAAAGAGPTGSASATETSGSDSGSGPSTATATSTFTFVITSGGSTITSTGVTTLFGTGGSNGSPSGTETTTVSGTASPTESASATDTSGSAETVSSSATSASSTAGGSVCDLSRPKLFSAILFVNDTAWNRYLPMPLAPHFTWPLALLPSCFESNRV